MSKAYSLSGYELQRELEKLPWLQVPFGLSELLVIYDARGFARHLRAYISTGAGKRLLEQGAITIDTALALVKVVRCSGVEYDLSNSYDAKIAEIVERFERADKTDPTLSEEALDEAYQLVRSHVLQTIELRLELVGQSPAAVRLRKVYEEIPNSLKETRPHHEPCFAEFDAWNHIALLLDLANDLNSHRSAASV